MIKFARSPIRALIFIKFIFSSFGYHSVIHWPDYYYLQFGFCFPFWISLRKRADSTSHAQIHCYSSSRKIEKTVHSNLNKSGISMGCFMDKNYRNWHVSMILKRKFFSTLVEHREILVSGQWSSSTSHWIFTLTWIGWLNLVATTWKLQRRKTKFTSRDGRNKINKFWQSKTEERKKKHSLDKSV